MKKLFNLLFIISSILTLSACAESSDLIDTDPTNTDTTNTDSTHIDSFEISDIGSTTDLNKSGKYNLEISGNKNIVTIKSNNTINDLKISGVSNTIYIEPNTSVSNLTVSGTKNVVYVPLNSQISFTDTETGNELKTQTTNSILGSWSYTHPDTQCVVSYLFNTNGTFSGKSLDKIFSGIYSFEKTVVTGIKHSLKVTYSADNALANCSGVPDDVTGKIGTTYIIFLNSNAMQWYTKRTGDTSIILKKQS